MNTNNSNVKEIENDIRIGLWGTVSSGKTTYLAMLYDALVLSEDWQVTVDEKARRFVEEHLRKIEQGNFPLPTEKTQKLKIFTYTLRPKSSTGIGPKIVLNFLDAPGEFYEEIDIKAEAETHNNSQIEDDFKDIVDYLLKCHGIIFLLDPVRSKKAGLSYRSLLLNLFLEFQERSKTEENEILQQFMAFCVTKVDKEEIWPQTIDSAKLAEDIMSWQMFQSLNNFCYPNRYKFFSVASIGRYEDKDGNWKESVIYPNNTSETFTSQSSPDDYYEGYDPDAEVGKSNNTNYSSTGGFASNDNRVDSNKASKIQNLPTINTDVKYDRFNVIEPIKWLIKSIQGEPPELPKDKT